MVTQPHRDTDASLTDQTKRRWWARLVTPFPSDVFGSDVFVSYQATYVWQANQFGHLLIGFGLSFVLLWFSSPFSWSFWLLVLVYAVKELIDYLIALAQAQGFFRIDRRELV